MCVCEFIKIRIISPQGLILSTFEATLINETYSIYNETHTHTHYYHLHSRCFFDNVRSNPFKMYKYSRQERLRVSSSPNRNANLHHVNRTTFYQISPIPTYLNTRWYFAYRTPLHAPCTTITRKQVSTCHIAIRNRPVAYNLYAAVVAPLLLLFTTLLRHVGSSQRVVPPPPPPPPAKDNLRSVPQRTVARRSREGKERKKKSKERGRGHPTVDFPSWRDFTGPCTQMDIPCDTLRLNGRRFKNKKLLVQLPRREVLQATDREGEWGLHKIPDFYFEQTDFMKIVIAWSTIFRYFFKIFVYFRLQIIESERGRVIFLKIV